MLNFEEYKNKLLQDPELKKEWDALDPEFQKIRKAIIAKDDEWRNETEWDDIAKEKGISLE